MDDLDTLATLARGAKRGSGRGFPVYIARPRNRLDHCGHQHDSPSRARNCAINHGPDWIVLEAHGDGKEQEVAI